jgi:hypothetical protein
VLTKRDKCCKIITSVEKGGQTDGPFSAAARKNALETTIMQNKIKGELTMYYQNKKSCKVIAILLAVTMVLSLQMGIGVSAASPKTVRAQSAEQKTIAAVVESYLSECVYAIYLHEPRDTNEHTLLSLSESERHSIALSDTASKYYSKTRASVASEILKTIPSSNQRC